MLTVQSVSADSKECAKFLRKVARDNQDSRLWEGWKIRANDSTGWKLIFSRTVKGAIGEPDAEIEVSTDFKVAMPADSRFGEVKSFEDSRPVHVSRPSSIHLGNSDAAIVAKLLADGSRLSLVASSGSTHSSQHGLSFYHLEATFPGITYGSVQVGSTTVAKDGTTLVSGAVSIR